MGRTACLGLAVALLGYLAGAWLTLDFRVWTQEGARRLAIVQAPVAAPEMTVHGPGLEAASLPALLRSGGGITIVDFVYTRCPTVCLALGSTFQQLQSALVAQEAEKGFAAPIHLLSISFDPEHDSPEVLSAYAGRFHADPDLWRFAVPVRKDELRPLLDRFGVVVIPDGMGGYEHNAALLVVDGSGRLVRIFDYTEMAAALVFARHLAGGGES
ncbi:SCO family protein [Acidovorax sp. SDU_ACID1]|uniref:SCO family protein n=1 Tax=Acidovorax sp. SDU_ACID1 TaxID=3136632 RepID=UPI00387342F8